ncbi:MAG TPA: V-type ATP synthase subunit F [Lachnospiraceae bacterium]|nr:V-type ATP synthase subunit F [Lachnospiraceae bacterium]
MSKIAVMGDYDSVYGFGALGLDTFRVTDAVEGAELLKKLAEGEYGVIYMTEQLGEMLKKERAKYDDRISPAIILIPGVSGNTGEGITGVKGSVEKAVGSDILFGDM